MQQSLFIKCMQIAGLKLSIRNKLVKIAHEYSQGKNVFFPYENIYFSQKKSDIREYTFPNVLCQIKSTYIHMSTWKCNDT